MVEDVACEVTSLKYFKLVLLDLYVVGIYVGDLLI